MPPPSGPSTFHQPSPAGTKRKRPADHVPHIVRERLPPAPQSYTDTRSLHQHQKTEPSSSASFAVDPSYGPSHTHGGHQPCQKPCSPPSAIPLHDPTFTQGLENCQQPGGSCHDSTDPFQCTWEEFARQCDTTSVPCNNPNCADVAPCPTTFDDCADPLKCLGNICYDEHCVPNGQDGEFWCNAHCDEATRCVSPCFSDECGVPACHEPCLGAAQAGGDASQQHPIPALPPGHQMYGQDVLCQSHDCEIPGFHCVDPKCLSIHGGSTHVHHELSRFYDDPTQHQDAFGHYNAPPLGVNLQDPFSFALDQARLHSPLEFGSTDKNKKGKGKHASTDPMEHIIDFNRLPYSHGPNHHRTLSTGMSDAGWNSIPVPELSNSLTATPKSTDTSDLRTTISASPAAQAPHRHICMWAADADGAPAQACNQLFSSASDLHQHVERAHIDTLQREVSGATMHGYWCRWEGCNRNDPGSNSVSFAARPKLKRHIQTHTLYKPFICDTCGVSMKTKDAMEKHLRTHTGERPYRCPLPQCAKIFATSTELKTHMVVHSGKKPHECPICGESFADSSNLSKHKKTHFLGMYRCPAPGCGARMKRWDQMRRHIVSQGHARNLLDDGDAQREYKVRMEREWRELPDEEKMLPSGGSRGNVAP